MSILTNVRAGYPLQTIGFGDTPQPRSFQLIEMSSDPQKTPTPVPVNVLKTSSDSYAISVNGKDYTTTSTYSPTTQTFTSFFPHTRLETTIIPSTITNESTTTTELTLFHLGRQYRLALSPPAWAAKALGLKDVANSVLAPMPCKVLRVEIEAGAEVKKNQPLVVIESMKMETVIRSPQDKRISRVVHKAGDMCRAGTALVEFEGEEGQA